MIGTSRPSVGELQFTEFEMYLLDTTISKSKTDNDYSNKMKLGVN